VGWVAWNDTEEIKRFQMIKNQSIVLYHWFSSGSSVDTCNSTHPKILRPYDAITLYDFMAHTFVVRKGSDT